MQSFKTSSMPISLSQHDLNTPTLLCGIVDTCIQLDQLSTTSPQSLNRISSQYTENSNNWVRKLRQLIVLLHANTYKKLQSEFSRESLKTIFARLPPLASAARCGPHPRTSSLRASGGLSVCVSVGHKGEPYKNGWTDRQLWTRVGPTNHVRWGSDRPMGRGNSGGCSPSKMHCNSWSAEYGSTNYTTYTAYLKKQR